MLFANVAEFKENFYIYFMFVCETHYKIPDTISKFCECYSVFHVI